MGAIGAVTRGSDIAELRERVYAPNTVIHLITGLAYARALRAHLLTSAALEIMTEAQFRTFTKDGYFTIRRKDKFVFRGWGDFTDQIIEQVLVRKLKGQAQAKIIKKSVILFWLLNMTI